LLILDIKPQWGGIPGRREGLHARKIGRPAHRKNHIKVLGQLGILGFAARRKERTELPQCKKLNARRVQRHRSSRNAVRRRSHEFGTDRILDCRLQDAVDLRLGGRIEFPAAHLVDQLQLAGVARAPQRRRDPLIERPANRQMDELPAEAPLGKLVELFHGSEVLAEARLLEFRIGAAKIIALE